MKRTLLVIALGISALTLSVASARSQDAGVPAKAGAQMTFTTPQAAVDALIKATGDYDVPTLKKLFGPPGDDIIASADPVRDKNNIVAFADLARKKNAVNIDPNKPNRAIVVVGDNDWPLPFPLVKKSGKWQFDSAAGRTEILYRRIGSNELDAIEACHNYVDAQLQYASTIHDDFEVNQYAQKIISTPGKQDGLYWEDANGVPAGPISKGIAKALEEGYSLKEESAYHGYYFKILKGQGPAAHLGQLDYVIQGAMIGGFAMVAVPAQYRVTGVKTFLVSQDGTIYQKDMGPDSLKIAKDMERFNPDSTWQATTDAWPVGTDFQEESGQN